MRACQIPGLDSMLLPDRRCCCTKAPCPEVVGRQLFRMAAVRPNGKTKHADEGFRRTADPLLSRNPSRCLVEMHCWTRNSTSIGRSGCHTSRCTETPSEQVQTAFDMKESRFLS